MIEISSALVDACWRCLTLNGSIFYLIFPIIVIYFGISYDERLLIRPHKHMNPELGEFTIPTNSIHAEVVRYISKRLTPLWFVIIVRSITQKTKKITRINNRTFIGNLFFFFILYYLVVSAPAAAMAPINYNVSYDVQAILALFLMMITNAFGDVISLKITLSNIKKIFHTYQNSKNHEFESLRESMIFEAKIYLITIKDMLFALLILVAVLLLTSIYFGVSIGEFKFELTENTLNGALERISSFWSTALEPYWFVVDINPDTDKGLPMLFYYSLTSFIPTILILLTAITWTFTLPLRVIYYSNLTKFKKILISESVVIALCAFVILGTDMIGSISFFTYV